MIPRRFDLHSSWRILTFTIHLVQSLGLNTDGTLLLSFRSSVPFDPLGVLDNWNYQDQTPCSWNGITCGNLEMDNAYLRVIGLSLPNSQLLASIPPDLGSIQHLRTLDLSNNLINGSLPLSLFKPSELQMLDLSNNLISGDLPELVGALANLELLNLSDNAFRGKIPESLSNLPNLTVISLQKNYFSGDLPSGFNAAVEILDLSSNLINGTLPSNFTGNSLRYFNVSGNRLSGEIPSEFSNRIPVNATVDISFNNFTGEIPETRLFLNQAAESYSGNQKLCGKPLNNLCPATSSAPTTASPAIAAIPKAVDSAPATNSQGATNESTQKRLRTRIIVGIIAGGVFGLTILALLMSLKVYKWNKRKSKVTQSSEAAQESQGINPLLCFRKQANDEEGSSKFTSSDDNEEIVDGPKKGNENQMQRLVMVDGEKELELETLFKASVYILGATGSRIMYKAVLEDGTTVAVRRIGGESGVLERFSDFESQIQVIAKLVHPNLIRIHGFYWGADEKLVIYDFVPNGSLANALHRKMGHLPWEVRLKIARGVARGLTYIHEKKHVHGNLKPSKILLGLDMEPKIGDFGLERLLTGETSYKAGGSARSSACKRSMGSRDSFQDIEIGPTSCPISSSVGCILPYSAPESLRSLKPNPKWDVYSFGVVLLELLTGKVTVSDELGLGPNGLVDPEKSRVLSMVDVAIRADLEGNENALLAIFKLGFGCISPIPQKRPSMKDVLKALDKFSSSSSSSSSSYYFDQ